MRAGCVIALLGCAASLAAAAEQEFPYTAYIDAREAAARSGPGRNFYATEKLHQGDDVEVYQHQDDWCAIRPPQESFSWVKADDIRIDREGIGLVLKEGAPSRIGSHIGEHRDVIQVRLERGEQVEVRDAVPVSNDNGVEFYCKIAPPSGEFRWIHKDDISRERPEAESRPDSDHGPPPASTEEISGKEPRADRWGSWVRSRRDGHDSSGALFHEPAAARNRRSDRAVALASADDDKAGSRTKRDAASADDLSLSTELEAIDRELSRIVVEEPARWNFEAVRKRIDAVGGKTTKEPIRGKVRELESKIAKFEDIHNRSLALVAPSGSEAAGKAGLLAGAQRAPTQSTGGAITIPPASSPGSNAPVAPVVADAEARYDGLGKLTRVVSQRPNAPRYALVNHANEVVSFVSPAPGVNLQTYEGQYVGISGQRGYMPELKKPHVTALRVTPIQIGQTGVPRRR